MPTLEFGRQLKRAINNAVFSGNNSTPTHINIHSIVNVNPYTTSFRFRIMKGAYPTSWGDLAATTSRSTDTLIEFSNASNAITNISTAYTVYTNDVMTMNAPLTTATQSGTATWFWAYVLYDGVNLGFRWLGTNITTLGGGGDLEIDTLNIVSGTNYRITNFRIDLQSVYTY